MQVNFFLVHNNASFRQFEKLFSREKKDVLFCRFVNINKNRLIWHMSNHGQMPGKSVKYNY